MCSRVKYLNMLCYKNCGNVVFSYGEVYVIILRTQLRANKTRGERMSGAEVVLYQLVRYCRVLY